LSAKHKALAADPPAAWIQLMALMAEALEPHGFAKPRPMFTTVPAATPVP
jgi:hypothetical protein